VIEQAKGVLIAQAGCSPEAALVLLRSAARRSHVPLPELARRVVGQAAAGQRAEVLPPGQG